MLSFASAAGVEYLADCDVDLVARFRQSRKVGTRTSEKQRERLRSFFSFAVGRKWIEKNPAAALKPPIGSDEDIPVISFTRPQVKRIIDACGESDYLKTFLLVMRYSGLATVDAIKLTPDRLEGDYLKLRRTKTKGWVKVLLPKPIADRLREVKTHPCGFWFWNKQSDSTHETATGNMRRMLRPIFQSVKLKDGEGNRSPTGRYPYQFRHTFVKEQLEAGASLERIAEPLGNTYKIVEKHYSAWVPSRQVLLDEVVSKSWNKDELSNY